MAATPSPGEHRASLERQREREFYRYFDPLDFQFDPSMPAACSPDVALTAFAQLGCLRLNSRWSMISLLDRNTQYILAEATRSVALQDAALHEPEDNLWLGRTAFPRAGGICQLTVQLPMVFGLPGEENTPTSVIINDLTQDERFKAHPAVAGPPHLRFYAGTPIRAPNGQHIGSYCILDNAKRDGLDGSQLRFMSDLSGNIITHLENTRVKQEHRRSEMMVRGMGAFLEGKSSVESLQERSRGGLGIRRIESEGSISQKSEIEYPGPQGTHVTSASDTQRLEIRDFSVPDSSVRDSSIGPERAIVIDPTNPRESSLQLSIKNTFGRASNIIREATEVDGVVFLDASVASFGGHRADTIKEEPGSGFPSSSDGDGHRPEPSEPEEDSSCSILGFSTNDMASLSGDVANPDQPALTDRFLKSLLRNYPRGKVFNFNDDGMTSSSSETESTNQSSIPSDSSGSALLGVNAAVNATSGHRKKNARKIRLDTLQRVFKGASSLVFFPLWDSLKARWFAGAFVWTSKPTRIFTAETELTYLAAFGNSIMAEVAHVDALIADRIKGDFISSISHELRSPLHGILGSVEVLQDTVLNLFQGQMVDTVETCGRTLLDTFNHLLDFAKINNFTRMAETRTLSRRVRSASVRGRGKKSIISNVLSLDADIDLAIVTEEVVQTMCAPGNWRGSGPSTQTMPRRSSNFELTHPDAPVSFQDNDSGEGGSSPVSIIVDIDHAASWLFRTAPGGWRRVMMNLIGNCVKHTEEGYISIRLHAKDVITKSSEGRHSKVTLVVSDSGKGISKEYMRDRLFTPFSQEDPLTPGTGLGLSIVRQIVTSLGGSVDVQSQKWKGTEFRVTFNLLQTEPNTNAEERHHGKNIAAVVSQKTQGLKVALLGFTNKPIQGRNSSREIADTLWNSSIIRLCNNWFAMEVMEVSPEDLIGLAPDLIIAKETADISTTLRSCSSVPTIIVCPDVRKAYHDNSVAKPETLPQVVNYISQPIGPQKLAKALSECFDRGLLTSRALPGQRNTDEPEQISLNHEGSKTVDLPIIENQRRATEHNKDVDAGIPSEGLPQTLIAPPVSIVYPANHVPDGNIANVASVVSSAVVLLVDDNEINLKLLATFMNKMQVPYATAVNGLEALNAYKTHYQTLRIVFMDISMPIMNGMTATREIRRFEKACAAAETTIVALTGLASADAQQEAFASGINLFLTKPIRLRDLKDIINWK